MNPNNKLLKNPKAAAIPGFLWKVERPSMRTDRDQFFLDVALRYAYQGTCLRRNFGAVIIDSHGTQVSAGYTGPPVGEQHCHSCWRQEHNIPSGQAYEKCRSVHAEMNALLQAGKMARGATMYLNGYDVTTKLPVDILPCYLCAKMIINAGIEMVVMRDGDGDVIKFSPGAILEKREMEAFG